MRFRLRQGIAELLAARRLRRPPRQRGEVLKGCVQNVIVVKPPDRRFREAVFILRDDYLAAPGADKNALLRQAREAARDYARSLAPPVRRRFPLWLPPLLLAGAGAALYLLGLLPF